MKTISVAEAEKKIAEIYSQDGDYKAMYYRHSKLADAIWDNKTRKDYEADRWYNINRNEICIDMLGDMCRGMTVLSVGGGQWIEKDLLDALKPKEVFRTDIVGSNGIIEASVENLPFEDDTFDMVICRELIEHVKDEQVAYKEMKRVLKIGGYMLLTTPNAYTLAIDGTFHVRAYSPHSLLYEMGRQGFEVIKKRGNVPYLLQALFIYTLQGVDSVLEDFKEIDRLTRDYENRYYLSSQMFVLCRLVTK